MISTFLIPMMHNLEDDLIIRTFSLPRKTVYVNEFNQRSLCFIVLVGQCDSYEIYNLFHLNTC